MEPSIAFRIGINLIAFAVNLSCDFFIILDIIMEVVFIDKITAGIIGGIDINHLHFAIIGFLQKFQYFQIIPFDIEIFRIIPILAFFLTGTQCTHRGCLGQAQGFALAVPFETVAFLFIIHKIAQQLPQDIEINFPFLKCFGEKLLHGLQVFFGNIHGFAC